MITDFAGTPSRGVARRYGAYAGGVADSCAHSARSRYSWIAEAPGTVSVTGGRLRSGWFSLKFVKDGFGVLLYSRGEWKKSTCPTSGRKLGESRAISTTEPPGTFGTPAFTSGSTARKSVPYMPPNDCPK